MQESLKTIKTEEQIFFDTCGLERIKSIQPKMLQMRLKQKQSGCAGLFFPSDLYLIVQFIIAKLMKKW